MAPLECNRHQVSHVVSQGLSGTCCAVDHKQPVPPDLCCEHLGETPSMLRIPTTHRSRKNS